MMKTWTVEWGTKIMSLIRINQQAIAEANRQKRIAEIQSQLDNIDHQSVRPLRAKLAGTDTQADREKLEELENEAAILRDELNEII
jgi:hypothetical protein